jgi:hypothetical protein
METAAMQSLFDRLGMAMANAMRDRKISKGERANIKGISSQIEAEGKLLMNLLGNMGLGFKEAPDFSKMDLSKLWEKFAKNPKNKELVAEIKARLRIDVEDFKSQVVSAFDSDNLADFQTKLGVGIKQTVRDGLIAAFMESAAMKPLLDKLSNQAMDALKDGKVTQKELDGLTKTGDKIKGTGSKFFELLDQLGLGFKDLNDQLATTSESLTNVPSGFKVALTRFQVSDAVQRPRADFTTQATGGGGVAEQFKGAVINIRMPEGSNVDDILREMERRGGIKAGGQYGSPVGGRY